MEGINMDGNEMNNGLNTTQDPVLTGYDAPGEPAAPTEPAPAMEPTVAVTQPEINGYAQPEGNVYTAPETNGYVQAPNPDYGGQASNQSFAQQAPNTGYAQGAQSTVGQSFEYNQASSNYSAPLSGQVYNGNGIPDNSNSEDGAAIASLIMGICSILFCCCYGIFSIGLGIGGVVLASSSAKKRGGEYSGTARGGQITSIIGIVMGALFLLIFIALVATGSYAEIFSDF